MRYCVVGWLAVGLLALVPRALPGQEKKADAKEHEEKAKKEEEDKINKIRETLRKEFETTGLQTALPVPEFLAALGKKLPEPIEFKFDAEAFAKQFPEVAKTRVHLPAVPKRLTAFQALRVSLAKIDARHDYRIFPTHVLITTPERAAYTRVYDVSELIKLKKTLMEGAREGFGGIAKPPHMETTTDHPAAFLLQSVFQPFFQKPLRILNQSKLVLHDNDAGHEEFASIVDSLRRICDVSVMMQARLLEVDRAFYVNEVEPFLAKNKDKPGGVLMLPLEEDKHGEMLAKLVKGKVTLEGEPVKIRSGERDLFLSSHNTFSFKVSGADPKKEPERAFRIGLEGVGFWAATRVWPDRRGMSLRITRKVNQLGDMKKKIAFDAAGMEVEIDVPDLRETELTTNVDIEDGQPAIMAVDYRPRDLDAKRVWVVILQPRLWIQEEEDAIRRGELEPRKN